MSAWDEQGRPSNYTCASCLTLREPASGSIHSEVKRSKS